MSANNRIQKVAVVGASGHVGRHCVEQLLKTGKHSVTAISREDSKATFPPDVKVAHVNYDDPSTIVSALRGHDFLIISLYSRAPEGTHTKLVKAAVEAGIPWIMPNCFGGDITKADLQKDDLVSVRAYQNAMEIQEMGASYVAMCCGFWYEWSLALGEPAYGIDIKNRTATFFDDGMTKFNTSTWIHCGQALAALLSLPVKKEGDGPALEDWKNGLFFISSFKISQKDMLESVHRVLGTKDDDWQIQYEPSEKRYKDALEEFKKGSHLGFAKALYSRSLFPGALDFGDQVVDRKLSLPEENLDEATKRAADMALSGWNPFA